MANETPLSLDFADGGWQTDWSALECKDAGYQFHSETTIERIANTPTAHVRQRSTDISFNSLIRVLLAKYESTVTNGQHYWYSTSIYIPTTNSNGGANDIGQNLIWELHQGQEIYNLAGLDVAPLALLTRSGGTGSTGRRLYARFATGNGTVGGGWEYFESLATVIPALPYGTWVDLLIELSLSETWDGVFRVWYDTTGQASFRAAPDFERTGIPTTQYVASQNIHNAQLYHEYGLYTGDVSLNGGSDPTDLVLAGSWRRLSRADAVAALGGASPDPGPGPDPGGGTDTGLAFGKQTAGATMLGDLTGYKRASKFTLSENAAVSELREYLDTTATTTLVGCIHDDDGPDQRTPGTLLYQSAPVSFAANLAAGWQTVGTFTTPVVLSPGDYWLGTHNGSGANNTYRAGVDIVAGGEALRQDAYADGLSATWTSSEGGGQTGSYDYQLAINARYAHTTDTVAPSLTGASINRDTVTLTFSEQLDEASVPAASAFSVSRSGSLMGVRTVTVSDTSLTLTLTVQAGRNDTVTLTYTKPALSPLEDPAGNQVASFSRTLANVTPLIRRLHIPGGRIHNPAGRTDNPAGRLPDKGGGGI